LLRLFFKVRIDVWGTFHFKQNQSMVSSHLRLQHLRTVGLNEKPRRKKEYDSCVGNFRFAYSKLGWG